MARLRRNLSVAQVVERAICLRVLYALQLNDDILWSAKEDKLGKALQDLSLKTRKRASKKDKTHIFRCIKSEMVLLG